jgi:single-stranded DNA-binding protein
MFTKLTSGDFMVIGVLPKDAEFKTVGSKNSSICKFSVKASETEVDGKKDVKWTNCVAWHDVARVCQGYKKGDVVLVAGKLQDNNYTDSNGNAKTNKQLVVEFTVKMSTVAETVKPAEILQEVDLSEYDVLDGDAPF